MPLRHFDQQYDAQYDGTKAAKSPGIELKDQATRWLAFALTEVEQGFRRVSGHKDLPHLVAALERPHEVASVGAATERRP